MQADIIAQNASRIEGRYDVEVAITVTDPASLHALCSRIVRQLCLSKGMSELAVSSGDGYREDLIHLAAEHLAQRANHALCRLKLSIAADDLVSLPPFSVAIEKALNDWMAADHRHIDAACKLVVGTEPWQGWPSG